MDWMLEKGRPEVKLYAFFLLRNENRRRANRDRSNERKTSCCLPNLVTRVFRCGTSESPNENREFCDGRNLPQTVQEQQPRRSDRLQINFKKNAKKPDTVVEEKVYVKVGEASRKQDTAAAKETGYKETTNEQRWGDDTFEQFQRYPRTYSAEAERRALQEKWEQEIQLRDDIREVTYRVDEAGPSSANTETRNIKAEPRQQNNKSDSSKPQIEYETEERRSASPKTFGNLKKILKIPYGRDIARSQPVYTGSSDPESLSSLPQRPNTPTSPAPDSESARRDKSRTRRQKLRFADEEHFFDSRPPNKNLTSSDAFQRNVKKKTRRSDSRKKAKLKNLLELDSPNSSDSEIEFEFPKVGEERVQVKKLKETKTELPDPSDCAVTKMNNLNSNERKIIIEFCHLLEKSKQLFNGLRELPLYGHKCWHPYFERTFDVYTKLWKYQQEHRAILDTRYGLKRWQIGEIASKIGQLYYHFYLRTSETAYLSEACSFYSAIRGRSYYTQACKLDKSELVVKKLRYYARFIVVCLLLKKMKLVIELTKDLEILIRDYGQAYDPDDHLEWVIVLDEIKAFIQLEVIVSVVHPDSYTVVLSHRLNEYNKTTIERSPIMNIYLQEIIIIGSTEDQAKFSELSLDMFRILQTLERETTADRVSRNYEESHRKRHLTTPNLPRVENDTEPEESTVRDNPHKYLLYQPTPTQVLTYLASACNDLAPGGGLLLYISADGHFSSSPKDVIEEGYDRGGVLTSSKTEVYRQSDKDHHRSSHGKTKEANCLYPADLYAFTRRPLVVIVDSDNSGAFLSVGGSFGQPLVILTSPVKMPSNYLERKRQGNMFTLFMSCPFTGFSFITELFSVSLSQWERSQLHLEDFMNELSQIILRGRVDIMYLHFLGDDFLRLMIFRYIFCEMSIRMHRSFRSRNYWPRCSPPLPEDLLEHTRLKHIIFDLAKCLQVQQHFNDPSFNGPQ
ncbi:protein SCAI [Bombyx mandarina]|uniref:Protein SCAI n=1 Tax=Bombyx mandarina TaxID=7092 RepID=A0A6J2KLK7_BOMMA|nr:protein SCAI [Bombyx mandarina]